MVRRRRAPRRSVLLPSFTFGLIALLAAPGCGLRIRALGLDSALCNTSSDVGTSTDPYLIVTTADLAAIPSRDSPSANFLLCANLDFTGVAFTPIPSLSGTFEGNGFTISNLSLSTSDAGDAAGFGLFKSLSGASVSDLNLDAVTVTSTVGPAGALAGTATGAAIANVSITSAVVTGTSFVGGLVGDALNSTIAGTSFSGTVTNTGAASLGAGGLAGRMLRKDGDTSKIDISLSATSGTIVHPNYGNGGLVGVGGLADGSSVLRIERSHSDMSFTVKAWSGGLAGDFTGTIRNSSFTGVITSSSGGRTGGAIANNIAGATTIDHVFTTNTDNWTGNASHGSIVGYIPAGSVTIVDSFGAGYKLCATIGIACTTSGATAQVTTAQLQDPTFFPSAPDDWRNAAYWTLTSGAVPALYGL